MRWSNASTTRRAKGSAQPRGSPTPEPSPPTWPPNPSAPAAAVVARQARERRQGAHLAGAAQRGLDAGDQLHRVEGLDDVVVGAGGQAEDLVGREGPGGEHQHRDVGGAAVGAQAGGEPPSLPPPGTLPST